MLRYVTLRDSRDGSPEWRSLTALPLTFPTGVNGSSVARSRKWRRLSIRASEWHISTATEKMAESRLAFSLDSTNGTKVVSLTGTIWTYRKRRRLAVKLLLDSTGFPSSLFPV